jgi:hypothetical protein
MTQKTRRPYLLLATVILLLASVFRLWDLTTTPPGLLVEELHNVQLAERMRAGNVAVVYADVTPAREGFYYTLLAATGALFGRGLMLWRLPSVWMSLLGLCVTFSLMRRLFNGRMALLVMAYAAVAFWPVWMGRAVLHVTLMPLMTASLGYMLVRAFTARNASEAGLWFTVAGVGLGVAQYAHVTAWALVVTTLGVIVYLAFAFPATIRRERANIVYMLALAAVISLPLLVFMAGNTGVRAPMRLADQPGWLAALPGRLLATLGGLFLRGDISPDRNLPFRPILEPFSGALFLAGLGVTLARWRRSQYALLPIWFVLGLIPAVLQPHVPHFEYMVLVLPVVFAFPAVALDEVYRFLSSRPRALEALGGIVVLLVVGNSLWTARDKFVLWPQNGVVRFNYQSDIAVVAHYLDTSDDTSPVGLCVIPLDEDDDAFAVSNDVLLDYFMHRRNLLIRRFDCRQTLVLAQNGVSQRIVFLRSHYYDDLPGPLLAWLEYSEEEVIPGAPPGVVRRVEAEEELGVFLRGVAGSAPLAWPPEASGGPGPTALPATFTDNLQLEGYRVRDVQLLPGEVPEVTTYWRLTGPAPQRLLLFAHLRGKPGEIVAAEDAWGADMSSLQPDDVIVQYNLLQPTAAEGPESDTYRLAIGLYVPGTEHRLRVLDGDNPRSDRLLLQRVEIVD